MRSQSQSRRDGALGRSARPGSISWCATETIRSWTSVCLEIVDDWFQKLPDETQRAALKKMESLLDKEGVAFDFVGHRDAPPGLRIWCGATVETSDVEALLPWLDWAYGEIRQRRRRLIPIPDARGGSPCRKF